jgi:hypothetical protein
MFGPRVPLDPTPYEDFDASQLRAPRPASKSNQQTEEAPKDWKPRAYNPNKETAIEKEEQAKATRRMGYETGQPRAPTAVESHRGRKLFSQGEDGKKPDNLAIAPALALEDAAIRPSKKVGYEQATRLGAEEALERQPTKAHHGYHNAHNAGADGFCYSDTLPVYAVPPKAPVFTSALPAPAVSPDRPAVSRGTGNRHTKLW